MNYLFYLVLGGKVYTVGIAAFFVRWKSLIKRVYWERTRVSCPDWNLCHSIFAVSLMSCSSDRFWEMEAL